MYTADISTHTLTWSVTRQTHINRRRSLRNFNSHAHVERDATSKYTLSVLRHFNSHAHVERDGPAKKGGKGRVNFNSHAHVERDSIDAVADADQRDFNSHAHVERDVGMEDTADEPVNISTHTLTWSVTPCVAKICTRRIFQLTRSRGA